MAGFPESRYKCSIYGLWTLHPLFVGLSMAIRIKSKWHRSKRSRRNIEGSSKPKTLEDLSSVIAFNLWRIAHEAFRNLRKEDYEFKDEQQVTAVIVEVMAFLVQVVDRTVYGKIDETERGPFINAMVRNLGETLQANMVELRGEADYIKPFNETLNSRFAEYAECPYSTDEGEGFAFRRLLGEKVAEQMAATDNRWIVEQIMDVEAPPAMKNLQRLVIDVLGLR